MTTRCRYGALKPLPLLLALLVAGCMVGPDYRRPSMTVPAQFKQAKGWTRATPQDQLSKGEWWRVYNDPTLSSLLSQVKISNQNVAQYDALYRQARALTSGSRAKLYPSVTGSADTTRNGSAGSVDNTHKAEVSASWELDVWGKLRRTVEENQASAQASAAELANITLSAQSDLAQDYFQLRIMDQQIDLYQQSVEAYQRYLKVIDNKYRAGSESRATLAQAQTQLESARASALDLQWQRAQLEHAIAVLMGKSPAQFSLPATPLVATLPMIPTTLPAQLLQRRPDIAYAERNVASANAAIGVAEAAYYPDLTLSASGGFESSVLHNLISLPNRVWSLGPELSGTLLDFGATKASVEQARASYDASVASYRQSVLSAFQEVENYLVELTTLETEIAARQRAAQSAQESARVTYNQYQAGMIDYLDVATTENTSLTQQQNLLSLRSTQWTTSVQLIAALGGGWHDESR
ncbi:efflux transporter outer membrane subunit [Acerihabitans sp. TG2]|uniref:efflux transporter outer membrane subunit n=1 Tax=Acerihabitans sp. TG2 TaxID=3096008 RepID=UPI002B228619|nr:efflux transporter outer membrane subunit [Acerihabitans sp. TG2]MEA9389614.1 efflux transporter outer membrane subunit [Acerihabitans sp. TG2]